MAKKIKGEGEKMYVEKKPFYKRVRRRNYYISH